MKEYTERYLEVKKVLKPVGGSGSIAGSTMLNQASGAALPGAMASKPSLMGSLNQLASVGGQKQPDEETANLAAIVGGGGASGLLN
jgi:hypothetical protein